jgi:adenine-specific DNA-methyltransferase
VKCIYIDPPYNTRSAFEQYDDNLEHAQWLSTIYGRLVLLRDFMAEDGSIWISIDEDEHAYLRVICDEIFGRSKFISTIVWQKRYAPDSRVAISDAHEYVLCYAANPKKFKEDRNLLPLTDEQKKQFKNHDDDPRGPWKARDFTAPGYRPNQMYEITLPSGRVVTPPGGRCWRVTRAGFDAFTAQS